MEQLEGPSVNFQYVPISGVINKTAEILCPQPDFGNKSNIAAGKLMKLWVH
jgi:hypothetical protein